MDVNFCLKNWKICLGFVFVILLLGSGLFSLDSYDKKYNLGEDLINKINVSIFCNAPNKNKIDSNIELVFSGYNKSINKTKIDVEFYGEQNNGYNSKIIGKNNSESYYLNLTLKNSFNSVELLDLFHNEYVLYAKITLTYKDFSLWDHIGSILTPNKGYPQIVLSSPQCKQKEIYESI